MKINANVNLTGDLSLEDASNDSVLTIKDDVNGGTLSIESTANDGNNVQAGAINFDPGESTGSEVAASITAQSSGTTATNRGGKITIKTKSDNGNLLNRLFIDKDSLETENLLTANINATTVNLQAGGTNKLSTTNTYVAATVPVALLDGSASAPALTNTGDENTGIYFGAADTVNIATNGIERLNINNSTITAGRNIDMQSTYQINNLPNPSTNQQAATKAYVDTAASAATKIDIFTSSGTWTKPAGAKKVVVFIADGGSGGQGGAKFNLSNEQLLCTSRTSGGNSPETTTTISGTGGTGGSFSIFEIDAASISPTVAVTVGAGGQGGASRSTIGTANAGSSGGNSSFGIFTTSFSAEFANWKNFKTSGTGGISGRFTINYDFDFLIGGGGADTDGGAFIVAFTPSVCSSCTTNNLTYTSYGFNSAVILSGGTSAINGSATNSSTHSTEVSRNVGAGGGGGGSVLLYNSSLSSTAVTAGNGSSGQIPGGGGGAGGFIFNVCSSSSTCAGNSTWYAARQGSSSAWVCVGALNTATMTSNYTNQITGAGGNGGRGEVIVITYF